jgi:hypothetical protein
MIVRAVDPMLDYSVRQIGRLYCNRSRSVTAIPSGYGVVRPWFFGARYLAEHVLASAKAIAASAEANKYQRLVSATWRPSRRSNRQTD